MTKVMTVDNHPTGEMAKNYYHFQYEYDTILNNYAKICFFMETLMGWVVIFFLSLAHFFLP